MGNACANSAHKQYEIFVDRLKKIIALVLSGYKNNKPP